MKTRSLSNLLQEKAEIEINENTEKTAQDLNLIKEWLQKQTHLNFQIEDQLLLGFLRGCKFNMQRTKEKLDYYYTMRTLLPEFFQDRDPFLPEIQDVLNQGVVLPLPVTKDIVGPRIVLLRWNGCHPNRISLVSLTKVYFMVMDILMNEDDNCMVAGKEIVADYKEFRAAYATHFTPSFVKKIAHCLQLAYPIRIKKICVFNSPTVFETIFNWGVLFFPEKLRKRMHLYSKQNYENVFAQVSQSLLPKEYGGTNGSVDEIKEEWKRKLESYRDWFLENENLCSHEDSRIGHPHTMADIFGVEGTFRKLNID